MAKIDLVYGFSKNPDIEQAVREASVQIRKKLSASGVDSCIVLFNLPQQQVGRLSLYIKQTLNPSSIVGYSLPLLIVEEEVFKRGIIIISLSGVELASEIYSADKDVLNSSEEFIWKMLNKHRGKTRELLLSFSGLDFSSAQGYLKGIERGLGRNFPLLGIFSCRELAASLVLANDQVVKNSSLNILFFGELKSSLDINSGFNPLGPDGEVTSFEGNVIKRINHKPAINFYRDYFQEKVSRSETYFRNIANRYPLGFRIEDSSDYVISSPLRLNPDGSLIFLRDIPSRWLKLMISSRDSLIEACQSSAKLCSRDLKDPKIAMFFDSFARHKLLATNYHRQLKALKQSLGGLPLVGGVSFYALGAQRGSLGLGHSICEHSFSLMLLGGK